MIRLYAEALMPPAGKFLPPHIGVAVALCVAVSCLSLSLAVWSLIQPAAPTCGVQR